MKRALVLSGGGTAGGAWMLGMVDALRSEGVDLPDADLIVGTSAGARVGAALATGVLGEVIEMYRRSEVPPIELPAGAFEEFVATSMRIVAEAAGRDQAARRIANLEPLGPRLASDADRRRMIAAHLPVQEWPEGLAITAVDAESGGRAVFDRDSGLGLLDAVTASGTLPGIFPLVTIDGRRYADGGVHSLYNADLAAGHDVVTVLSPMSLNPYLRGLLDSEVGALGEATVRVIVADDASLAAIGPNPGSAETAPAALEAGAAQGRAVTRQGGM